MIDKKIINEIKKNKKGINIENYIDFHTPANRQLTSLFH